MKIRIIASALLIIVLAGITVNADANPWRGCYRGGWYPHPVVRICAPHVFIPPVPVVVGGYYGRPYYGPRYYAHGYYGHPHYGHRYYR